MFQFMSEMTLDCCPRTRQNMSEMTFIYCQVIGHFVSKTTLTYN